MDAILPSTETLPSTEATTTTEEAVENRKPMEDSGSPVLESAISIARGDDYPDYLKKIPYANYTIDPWATTIANVRHLLLFVWYTPMVLQMSEIS